MDDATIRPEAGAPFAEAAPLHLHEAAHMVMATARIDMQKMQEDMLASEYKEQHEQP